MVGLRIGARVVSRHGLTSSHPTGKTVKRSTLGVVAGIEKTPWDVTLYSVVFEVPGEPDKMIVVDGISDRDVVALDHYHGTGQGLKDAS